MLKEAELSLACAWKADKNDPRSKLIHCFIDQHLGELLEFYKRMAVDSFDTDRDDAYHPKTLAIFQGSSGDNREIGTRVAPRYPGLEY